MDLRTGFPRSMRCLMEGYVHLARMIDKCRAVLAGTEGEYIYPCPMDERLFQFTRVTAEGFTEAVRTHPDDAGVAAWFRPHAASHTATEIADWNVAMLSRGPSTAEKQAYYNQLRDQIDPSRTDLTSWADLQDLEEGRSVPRRA
ncbi:MAG: DUF5069 domain-containing protein [Nitrospiraceae bacterium]